MKLTTQSEYSLLALLYLTRNVDKGYIPLATIAKEQELPFKYLEQLMHTLIRAGVVRGLKGQHGGYQLAHKPEEITIAEIIRLFDGPLAPIASVSRYFYKPSMMEKEKKLSKVMKEIRDYVSAKLEAVTLRDMT
ncbi:MAG: Rrf2 family transcriptional regulator [Candidatus Omnitrophica bacterium]|nr:Rrf2 family transcriptional regulator [Candidatus Omnitrophota bacterium]